MISDEIRRQMMLLWKKTFHDTDEYINLVFDNYYSTDRVEYYEIDGIIVSALMEIPYKFGWKNHEINGMYLCGLMTDQKYRRRGIMQILLERAIKKAKNEDYAFCFLIPADIGLMKYYSVHGYSNAFYRVANRYTALHNFRHEYNTFVMNNNERTGELKMRFYDSLKFEKILLSNDNIDNNIINFIYEKENNSEFIVMRHSHKDIELFLRENYLSNNSSFFVKDKKGKITAVAVTEEDNDVISVLHIYATDLCSKMCILDGIRLAGAGKSLLVYEYPEASHRTALWNRSYVATDETSQLSLVTQTSERVYNVAAHANSYGMIRLVDILTVLELLADWKREMKTKILVREAKESIGYYYSIEKGYCNKRMVSDGELIKLEKDNSVLTLTSYQLQEILCRRPDTDRLIMEAFGLPRLGLDTCLLLD